ncbi:MAG: cyclic nucleotide-binding domain-containing protein, partial [Anaerolineae bacterium]|nr:cyclic nucleotide-binding domain-containing protein [Anaerolineae bacterium]
ADYATSGGLISIQEDGEPMSEISEFLSKVPMFSRLNKRHLNKLASRVKERTYNADDVIIEQGTNGVGLFIIVSGNTDVVIKQPDGGRKVIDKKGAYDFVGELSLLDDYPRTATVVATEPVTCYVLFKLDFLDAVRDEPEIAIEIMREMSTRFRRLVASM